MLSLNPLKHEGGGALYVPPPPLFFCLLLKISWGNLYLEILDLASLFVADAPIYKEKEKFSFTPSFEHFEISIQKPPVHERVNIGSAKFSTNK